MPQPYTTNNFSMGIDRFRNQSPPKDGTFFDLVNCYLTPGHSIKRRPGFTKDQALAGAFGATSYAGKIHTFYSGVDPGSNALVQTHKLVCPDGSLSALSKVYYCAPLGGYLYVVAGFANGKTFHFYLDDVNLGVWTASTHLAYGNVRAPTVENGFHYQLTSKPADPNWSPNMNVTAGTTYVQPSVNNGYRYKATAVTLPAGITQGLTGNVEPSWPQVPGQTVVETITKTETITKPVFLSKDGSERQDFQHDWRPGYSHAAGEIIVPRRLRGLGIGLQAAYNNEGSLNVNYTGAAEPNWPNSVGSTVNDGSITWTVVEVVQITWMCVDFNTTGAAEPVWPTVIGNTVVDGTATWTAIGRNITDPNCPNNPSAIVAAGKVWSIDPSGNVKFCGVANARAWSTVDAEWASGIQYNVGDLVFDTRDNVQKCTRQGLSGENPPDFSNIFNTATDEGSGAPAWVNYGITAPGDAGYLPVGLDAEGDTTPLTLAMYRGALVVFTGSGYQIWQVDQDPANNTLLDTFEGVGNPFLRGAASIGKGDLYFPTPSGIRSLGTVQATGDFDAGDAGMPIDSLVSPNLSVADTFSPIAIAPPNLGQYWLILGQNVYVMSRYEALEVEGWTRYTLPWSPKYVTSLNGVVYVLADDGNLYHQNPAYHQDDTAGAPSVFTMQVIWPYVVLGRHTMFQPAATMGYSKIVRGVAAITLNPISFQAGYDEGNLAALTAVKTIGPDDRQGGIVDCDVMCNSFSPQLSHAVNQDQEVFSFTTFYDVLQQMVA